MLEPPDDDIPEPVGLGASVQRVIARRSPRRAPASRVRPTQGLPAQRAAWLLAGVGALLILLTLALALGFEPLDRLDQAVAHWGYEATWGHAGRTSWWVAVAAFGQPIVLRGVLVVVALLFALKRRRAVALWLAGITAAETLIAPSTKHLLSRPRPVWVQPIAVERSLSYPSGHAAMAGTFAVAVILLALAAMTPGWDRRLVVLLALLVYVVISVDRVFLGVHYLSDVVGGNLLGVGIALIGWLVLLRSTRARTVS